MVIAYMRVRTEKQVLENQRSEIVRFAEHKGLTIQKWQTEKISGVKRKEERKLSGTLKKLKKDDVLIISEMSRLSRTMLEIMSILRSGRNGGEMRQIRVKKGAYRPSLILPPVRT